MGRPAGWLKELTGRSAMISPGAPKTRRSIERRFWKEIATGRSSEDAAGKVGVSAAVGARWFRQGGGMRTIELTEPGGRYLSFPEREEIAVLHAQQVGGARSRAGSTATRPRSRASCVETPLPAAGSWSTGPRSRSGRRS